MSTDVFFTFYSAILMVAIILIVIQKPIIIGTNDLDQRRGVLKYRGFIGLLVLSSSLLLNFILIWGNHLSISNFFASLDVTTSMIMITIIFFYFGIKIDNAFPDEINAKNTNVIKKYFFYLSQGIIYAFYFFAVGSPAFLRCPIEKWLSVDTTNCNFLIDEIINPITYPIRLTALWNRSTEVFILHGVSQIWAMVVNIAILVMITYMGYYLLLKNNKSI